MAMGIQAVTVHLDNSLGMCFDSLLGAESGVSGKALACCTRGVRAWQAQLHA